MVKPHKTQKQKTCRNTECRAKFTPSKPMQTWCQPECGLAIARARQARQKLNADKADRAEAREKRERLKSKAEHAKETQQAVNEFIRLRDANEPCISCGRHHQGAYHAGHYRSTKAVPELRFEPRNIHKQCAPCNTHLSGNLVEYRLRLIQKIGQDAVDWLEGPHEPKRYTIPELQAIKAEYRAKTRELKRKAG